MQSDAVAVRADGLVGKAAHSSAEVADSSPTRSSDFCLGHADFPQAGYTFEKVVFLLGV